MVIESEFAKLQLLPTEMWQAELCGRDDLDDAQKEELVRLLTAHKRMPEEFMDGERVRERYDRTKEVFENKKECARSDFEAGDLIGSYSLESKLGEGGFAVVWRARQTEPVVREVALKILKLGMDSVAILKRFKVEQQMLAMMEHPNIAKLIEAGMTANGRPFFAMELVRGSPFTEYCDTRSLNVRERLELFSDVCLAVNHAHQKGAIHRDLKPSNILVFDDPSGPIVKVIDFGISQVTKRSQEYFTQAVTVPGEILGTPTYMAPEQFSQDASVDTRADIHALGAILYELLVGSPPAPKGRLPISGEIRGVAGEAGRDITRPSTVLRRLDPGDRAGIARSRGVSGAELLGLVRNDLEWIAMRALDTEPEARYATVVGLVNDIRRSQANEPIRARPPSRRYVFQKYLRRNRGAVLAGCSITLALLVAALFGGSQARISRQAAEVAELARRAEQEIRMRSETTARRAERAETEAVEQREIARRHTYASDMLLAFQSHRQNDLRRTSRLLRQYHPVEGFEDLRGWEWRYLWGRTRAKTVVELGSYSERVLSALFCSSGEALVTYEDHGRIALRSLNEEHPEVLLSASSPLSRLESSGGFLSANPGATMIACLHHDGLTGDYLVKIWGDPEGPPIRSLNVGSRRPTGVALSPGGDLVAFFVPADGQATVMEVTSGAVLHREKLNRGNYSKLDQEGACSFSSDGKLLALGGDDGRIVILQVPDWTPLPKQPRITGRVTTFAFSPDGRHLCAGSLFQDPRVSIFDLVGDGEDIHLSGHAGFIAKVAFSPDGSLLASGSGDQNIKIWRTSDWTEVANLSGHRDEVWSVCFSPNGRTLVSSGKDQSVKLWQVDDWLKEEESALVLQNSFRHIALTPQGIGALTLRNGTVNFHGDVRGAPEAHPVDFSHAFWISEDRLVCGGTSPPQITIRDLTGGVEQRLDLPSEARNLRYRFLGESGILVVLMTFPESDLVRVDRYDVASLSRRSSTSVEISETGWQNLGRHLEFSSFSHDGGRVALRHDWDAVKVYDLVTGELVRVLNNIDQHGVQGLCLSPDGETVAYAVRKRPVIEVYDVGTGRSRARLEGHNMVIRKLDFSPDGERLVSSAIGREPILLWDTTEWEQVASFEPTEGCVSPLAWFLPSGEEIVIRERLLGAEQCQFRLLKAPSEEGITQHEGRGR